MKKIMFNDLYGLTHAVLDGRKTQTRRVIKIQEGEEIEPCYFNGVLSCAHAKNNHIAFYPQYKVGEEVAIAQSYRDEYSIWEILKLLHPERTPQVGDRVGAGWRNKMFVRADLMPHRIRITNVRVERLQDISEEDCLKEGVRCFSSREFGVDGIRIPHSKSIDGKYVMNIFPSPREAYAALIDKTCGRGTWDSNPYVFVYDFELIK